MRRTIVVLALALLGSSVVVVPAHAEETLRYRWSLHGALSWLAGLKFPTSGVGILQTTPGAGAVHSSLRVSAGDRDYFEYRSSMDQSANRTLMSMNGYSFGSRSERKETVYDYDANVARVTEVEHGQTNSKTRPLPNDEARDVLTMIAYLREHAETISAPMITNLFSDGKQYRVNIEPQGLQTAEWQGRNVPARVFKVSPAPGTTGKATGTFTVWLSPDAQSLPLRIVLQQRFASIDLKLAGM